MTTDKTDKKEQIIHAAIELFAEKGFEGTSIRELAARADVNLAMVNYYFGSKENLFLAIVAYKAAFMRDKLDEIVSSKTMTEVEKIDAVIENYVNRILNHPLFHRILYQELLIGDRKEFHEKILSNFSRNTGMLRSVIESGIRKKVFKKVDPELTMATLIGTINQVMLSKSLCCMLLNRDVNFDPYTDKTFQHRLTRHLKQLIHAYLLHSPSEES